MRISAHPADSKMCLLTHCVWLGLVSHLAAAEPDGKEATLQLANGGYVSGQLIDSDSAAEVTWQGTQFTGPFRFPFRLVESISYPQPEELPQPTGEFCFELTGGDLFFGRLLAVTDDVIEIEEARFGRLSLRRTHILRFFQNSGRELIYAGPVGLKDWTTEAEFWEEDGGHLRTTHPGARLRGDFQLPARAAFELELSWKAKPNFSIGLGTTGEKTPASNTFRLEIVENDLVAICETPKVADVAVVTPVGADEGRVQFQAYLDQTRGQLVVYSVTGMLLANLQVDVPEAQIGDGVTLVNLQGDIRLERLRISRWNGSLPLVSAGDAARFLPNDGQAETGQLRGFDAEQKSLTFQGGDRQVTRAIAEIQEVVLNPPPAAPPADKRKESVNQNQDAKPSSGDSPSIQLVYLDGTRLAGQAESFGTDAIEVKSSSVMNSILAPVAELRRVQGLLVEKAVGTGPNQRETLEVPGTKLRGRLVASAAGSKGSCLAWHPEYSEAAGSLRDDVSGKVVYRVPAPVKPPAPPRQPNAIIRRRANVKMLEINKIAQAEATVPNPAANAPAENRFLHLRSGDTIPCNVTSINEQGVTFQTMMSNATFVPHDQIKAVELIKLATTPKIKRVKLDRLLTLPRMQRDSPPTQLLISTAGDILRGRVLEMTEEEVAVEVRLDVRRLERRRIAQIIWLHPDELETEETASVNEEAATVADGALRVQVQRSDGIRLTYLADRLEDKVLSGRSRLLGECRTDLSQVDQLLIGDAIEQSAAMLAYHRWKLHHAVDPKFVQEESEGGDTGQNSPLVGKPAPDFTLARLDGTKFRLSEAKGEIVVLEFWATWCGYCMQSLPHVAQIVDEFRDAKVQLVAVNLEEAPKQITTTLERHGLEVPVVLDQDGVAGARYAVTSLPHTVIIDRAGNVFRVFIGAGDDLAENLRAALKAAIEPTPEDAAAKTESN